MKYTLRLIENRLVIDMEKHDAKSFKSKSYTGLPETFELDEMCLAPVIGVVELNDEQEAKISAAFECGGKCDWCDEPSAELSHPHIFDPAVGKRICRNCWNHDREVYKGSYGEDIGEFKPIKSEKENVL